MGPGARRGEAAAAAAAALFGAEGTSPTAPCSWDFAPMLAALEGAEDGDALDAEVGQDGRCTQNSVDPRIERRLPGFNRFRYQLYG